MRRILFIPLLFISLMSIKPVIAQQKDFVIKGFHLDLRIQVMKMDALKKFAKTLSEDGINTLVMEWEGTFPFEKHPLIPNRYAYTKEEIKSFISYCGKLGIDVIPLQQSFGHVEYILRHERYKNLREDQKDYSQVCPSEEEGDKKLFTDLFTEMAALHPSKYFHIGGDETYLLGHCEKCRKKAAEEGLSKLYIDHIKMLCDIVISLGKIPVLWADIALKYPGAIKELPTQTVFVDWNYGWDMNNFGEHEKLVQSGYEVWGAPALRSHPDNYFLTEWEKHFKNISDFIPACRKLGYKGMVMTSWSTSGQYSPVFETSDDIIDLYAIRHVYPITGFNMLLKAYTQSLRTDKPLDIPNFIHAYSKQQFGFNEEQSEAFWKALTMAPYEVKQGEVVSPAPMTVQQLADSQATAVKILYDLKPVKNKEEFEHYRLMADIRMQYLNYQKIEKQVNMPSFSKRQLPGIVQQLQQLLADSKKLDQRFIDLNKNTLYMSELQQENNLRDSKINLLYERLTKERG
ncbi:MAG TPA: beta-N-acetylhexosaminidase [Hanamia sp.]|nr:beta-N-acetylhexosaminidase [Hanamia sp.]